MNQTASATPTTPILQHALGSLELDLDAELRRYRRHRVAEYPGDRPTPEPWQGTVSQIAEPVEVPARAEIPAPSAPESFVNVSLPTPENPVSRSPEVDQVLEMLKQGKTDQGTKELLNLENRDVPPQDYLESSEELLKSLDDSASTPAPEAKRRFTPWQIGLVAVGSVGVTALISAVFFSNTFRPATNGEDLTSTVTEATAIAPDATPTPEPTTLNLASEEFLSLSLENLSVVNPDEEAIAAAAQPQTPPTEAQTQPLPEAQPVVPPAPLAPPSGRDNLAAALLPPSLRPQPATPFPVTPQIAAAGASSTPMVTPDGLKVGYYYVVFRNTSPASLGKAREQVRDAFVRTFPIGAAIQMAELNSEAKAKELVKKFNDAKIAAEIYHHQLKPATN